MPKIDLNPNFKKALNLMENTSRNVFVTGKAGTGKSTLLEYFRAKTKKKIVVLAPTGVAAINVKGQTIHSFFGFKPNITLGKVKRKYGKNEKRNIYSKLDAIVIDEVSMVRADLLDCVDKFMRLNGKNSKLPFGGTQMIFIGDLYQLPPVVTGNEREIFRTNYQSPYFFSAKVFENFPMEFLELEKIYRQKDSSFINLLNSIRNNSITHEDIGILNKRLDPAFKSSEKDFYVYLTTTNNLAEIINEEKLKEVKQKLFRFKGNISGNFERSSLPTQIDLLLKEGSQVMLLNNDSAKRWVNGSIGKIISIKDDEEGENKIIVVKLNSGKTVEVAPYTWEIFKFSYDERKKSIRSDTVGSFTQYPLKLAWALTIHKSQGKTFDKVIIDIGTGTFSHGQVYVALSRCTSFEGIILKKPIEKKHIFMDWRVVKFVTGYQYKISEETFSTEEKILAIKRAIKDKTKIQITYLKANDVKSERIIRPHSVGEMEYLKKTYLGMEAFCETQKEKRVFRIDRILELKTL